MDWSTLNHQASQQHIPHDLLAREDIQRAILAHLSQSGFFDAGGFQGGTALRLVYGNRRFSEDLDFVTRASVPADRYQRLWRPFPKRWPVVSLISTTLG